MRPGDILTHCFTGGDMRIIDDAGRLRDEARRVWDSGVIMDIGHGAGSFSFETAEALMDAGLPAGCDLVGHPPAQHPGPHVRPADLP